MFRYLHSHDTRNAKIIFPLGKGRFSPFSLIFLLILARESLSVLYYYLTIMVKDVLKINSA